MFMARLSDARGTAKIVVFCQRPGLHRMHGRRQLDSARTHGERSDRADDRALFRSELADTGAPTNAGKLRANTLWPLTPPDTEEGARVVIDADQRPTVNDFSGLIGKLFHR